MKKYIGIFAVCLSVVTTAAFCDDKQTEPAHKKKAEAIEAEEKRKQIGADAMYDKYIKQQEIHEEVQAWLNGGKKPDTSYRGSNKNSSPSSFETSVEPINESGKLNRSRTSRKVAVKDLCQRELGATTKADTEYCEYISPIYGICDTHAYNAGLTKNPDNDTTRETMDDIIATKVTVLSQQMYKQYEYLSATLHRIETQLNKAVLTAQLEMAGAKSDGSSGSSSSRSNDKEIVLAGAGNCWNESSPSGAYRCIQQNANLVKSNAQTNRKQAREQLEKTIEVAERWGIEVCNGYSEKTEQNGTKTKVCSKPCNKNTMSKADDIIKCANTLSIGVARALNEEEKDRLKYSSGRY